MNDMAEVDRLKSERDDLIARIEHIEKIEYPMKYKKGSENQDEYELFARGYDLAMKQVLDILKKGRG